MLGADQPARVALVDFAFAYALARVSIHLESNLSIAAVRV